MESKGLNRSISKRYDVLLRLLLVGETGVGKTCLLCRYANNEFIDTHITTIGVDFKMKTLDVDGKKVKVQIWDTAGQERFESITQQFYRRAQGILLVYDITSRHSFLAIPKWLKYIKQFAEEDVCVMLIGNKCDKEPRRQVTTREAQQYAAGENLMFYETSAKKCENLDQTIYDICKGVLTAQSNKSESDISFRRNHHSVNRKIQHTNHTYTQQNVQVENTLINSQGTLDADHSDTVQLIQDDKSGTHKNWTCC